MREKEIRRLVKIVEEANISELEVSRWGRKVKISKYTNNVAPLSSSASANQTIQAAAAAPPAEPVKEPAAQKEEPGPGEEIKSPMVGTFYRSPAPDADPYVQVGDVVQKGQVLCIIEAMKLMNEVEAEFPCKILKILPENAQPVEYNQPLFVVERV